jgi:hyaluronoglucosaminidase
MHGKGIERLVHTGEATRKAGIVSPVPRSFAVRGIVEGFYGTPWTHQARLDAISFLAPRGMNAYVYAPKEDPKHRDQWRVPYDADETTKFRELAAHATAHDVRLGFSISPGLDVDYESATDRAILGDKLLGLAEDGVRWFLLLLDDIPLRADLAPRQADLASALLQGMCSPYPDATLTVCPTEYVGTRPSRYLSELSTRLPKEIDLFWTGPTVCSPEISAADARGWTKAVAGHRVLLWDNFPVNDALMTNALHLGPYRGRDPELADMLGGVLCNPMTQAHASFVALATALDFLRAPDTYDMDASWAGAINDVGGERATPLGVLARACADSPIATPDTLSLCASIGELEAELDFSGWVAAVEPLAAELRAARNLTEDFPPATAEPGGDALATEVGPWALAARMQAEAGLAALRLLQQIRPVAVVEADGTGRAFGTDAESAMAHVFALLYVWTGARADNKNVYGPRFAVYTPVIQLADGAPGVDAAAAVREDANAVDGLCRVALRAYDDWREQRDDTTLRVFVDGEERPVADDGTFDGRGEMVLVREGPWCTRVSHRGAGMPFRDGRLTR